MTTTNTTQDWRPIPGWEGVYSIHLDGQVRSEARRVPKRASVVHERLLSPQTHYPSGLRSVLLFTDNRPRRHYIHRLLEAAFPELTQRSA